MTKQTMSEDISKIAFALSKTQGKMGSVCKSKTAGGKGFSYKYADLASIWDEIREPLSENELALIQTFVEEEGSNYLKTMLVHSSGQWISSYLQVDQHESYEPFKGEKLKVRNCTIQQLGSQITYLRRYGLSSILGITSDEDEDGKMANDVQDKKKKIEAISSNEPINEDNSRELLGLVKEIKDHSFIKNMLNHFKISSLDEIKQCDFSKVMNWVNRKIKEESDESRMA